MEKKILECFPQKASEGICSPTSWGSKDNKIITLLMTSSQVQVMLQMLSP